LERLFVLLTKVNFFPLEEEKKLAATAATNKQRRLFLLLSSTLWFMIKKIMRNEDHKKRERKSQDLLQCMTKRKSRETKILRKISRLTSQKKNCEVTPKNLEIFGLYE